MFDRKAIGSTLRSAREMQGLSRIDLVVDIRSGGQKMSEATVTRAERGDDTVSFESLHTLAAALGVELADVPATDALAQADAPPAWFSDAMQAQGDAFTRVLAELANIQEQVEALRDDFDTQQRRKAPK